MGRLEGKRIIVTGGTSGVGKAAVRAFVREGALVASVSSNESRGEAARVELASEGLEARFLYADIARRDGAFGGVGRAAEELGGVDALFCVAGTNCFTPIEDISEEELDRLISVNLKGTVFCNQAVFPLMRAKGGSIVNFGSQASLASGPDGAHYAASKAAVQAFTRKVAWDWGRYGIRANVVLPAARTPLFERLCCPEGVIDDAMEAALGRSFPLGRLGDPDDDIAPVLVFLASDESRYVTGQMIAVNGGSCVVR